MSLWYCATCTLLVKSAVDRPYCSICRQRILAKDTHLVIPRAELEELIRELALCNESFGCFEKHKHLIAKFRAKYLEVVK